jgi:hypothetical protein
MTGTAGQSTWPHYGLNVLMATCQSTGGYNCGFPCPKTLPFCSPQVLDPLRLVCADLAAQNQMILGGQPASLPRIAWNH